LIFLYISIFELLKRFNKHSGPKNYVAVIMLVKARRSNPIQRSRQVYAASDNESCVLASYLNNSYLFQL